MEFTDVLFKFLEQFLLAMIPVFVPILGALLIPKAIRAWQVVKEKSGIEPWVLDEIVRMAVQAAEQAKVAGYIDDKKGYAIDVASLWLKSKGIKLDLGLIDAAIEAAVLDMFNKPEKVGE